MIILKILLAIVGLAVVALAAICFFTELTEGLGLIAGFVGAAIVFFVFGNDKVSAFFGITDSLLDSIALGAMIGGGVLCAMDFGKLGAAMITAGWVAIGLVLIQVIPIPFISNIVEVASIPFTVACIPLLLIILIFI